MNYREPKIVEHLAFLSIKYNLYLSELYRGLVSARKNRRSICQDLKIEYRGTIKDQAVFLITKKKVVLAQFRVAEEFLLRKNISFENWLDTDRIRRQVARKSLANDSIRIQDLRNGMKKVNLKAEVLEIKEPQLVHTQYGNSVMLTNVWIADETGKIKLCLWGEQTDLPTVGDIVEIKRASVRSFKDERLLSLGKFGTLNVSSKLIVNNDNTSG